MLRPLLIIIAGIDVTLRKYLELNTAVTGWWSEFPKYAVSLLKAWFGDAATKANDFCFDYVPRISGNHSRISVLVLMATGGRSNG